MRITIGLRTLAISVLAVVLFAAVPAAQAKKHHRSKPRTAPYENVCHRAAHDSHLTADQRAAIAAACTQLKADLKAAGTKYDAAVVDAKTAYTLAHDALVAACSNGQGDTQACQDARTAFDQAKQQARRDLKAARDQRKQDVQAALSAFKSAVTTVTGGGDSHSGDNHSGTGDTPGGGGESHRGGTCSYLVSQAPADKQAALTAACAQLSAATLAAQSAFNQAVATARAAVSSAESAARAACGEGHRDSQACHDAYAAFRQAKTQLSAVTDAAGAQLHSALEAAQAAFKATLASVFGHPQGAGEPVHG
jgi:hypothetical protein